MMENNPLTNDSDALDALWDDELRLDQLAREAVQETLQEHKRRGQSVVIWRDGQIVTLAPDAIPVSPPPEDIP